VDHAYLATRLNAYLSLTRLNRPIGIYLLMWPMLWALWFAAQGVPDLKVLLIFIAGTVLTRSAGCAINDYADRNFDSHVSRTQTRPLATGDIRPAEALAITAVLMLIAFGLVLLTNRLTILLSFVALFLACSYPFAKRFTFWPQLVLGAAFSWAIPMSYAAQLGHLTHITWWVFAASVVWALAYDTIYAMADREDDIKIGIKSTAILFGSADIAIITLFQIVVLVIMIGIGVAMERGIAYFTSVALGLIFVAWQIYLIRDRNPSRCIQAFLNNNYLGMTIFLGIVIDYAFAW